MLLGIFSCKKVNTDDIPHRLNFQYNSKKMLELRMTDVVTLNDTLTGLIRFDKSLDSSLTSRLIERFTYLYLTTEKTDSNSSESIQRVDHKVFGDKKKEGDFKFFLIFDSPGEKIITFAIEDNLLLKPIDTNSLIDKKTVDYGARFQLTIHE